MVIKIGYISALFYLYTFVTIVYNVIVKKCFMKRKWSQLQH